MPEDAMIECPACTALNIEKEALLGVLGNLAHYRCRHCGIDFSEEAENAPSFADSE